MSGGYPVLSATVVSSSDMSSSEVGDCAADSDAVAAGVMSAELAIAAASPGVLSAALI